MTLIPIYTNSPTPQRSPEDQPTVVLVDHPWGREITVWDEPGEGMDTRVFLMVCEVLKDAGREPAAEATPAQVLADLALMCAGEAVVAPTE